MVVSSNVTVAVPSVIGICVVERPGQFVRVKKIKRKKFMYPALSAVCPDLLSLT